MKFYLILIVGILFSCSSPDVNNDHSPDSVNVQKDTASQRDVVVSQDSLPANIYTNERFRNVTVKHLNEQSFLVQGEAQIFEANFGWVIEDGHNELQHGFQMTDEGAPAWGNFKFTLDVEKKRANSSLHLILFELSAKDGSRQFELIIPLP
ncbi:MAG: Gmad2 immunoglobulin-like domain-containing protein [Bacteroidota bacterium]